MQIIEGLEKYTAIKVGDKYIIQLTGRYGHSSHLINGEKTSFSQYVADSLDGVYTCEKTERNLSHYSDGKSDMSVDGYERVLDCRRVFYCEDSEEYIYPDIETQVEVLRKIYSVKDFQPVYVDVVTPPEKVDINLVGVMEDTGSDFITTSYHLGKASFSGTGIYKLSPHVSIALSEWYILSKEFPDSSFTNSTHSGMVYAKVDGNYLFKDNDPYISDKFRSKVVYDSLEDAKAAEAAVRSFVRTRVNTYLNKSKPDSTTVSSLYRSLKSLESSVMNLEIKQKSSTSKKTVLTKLKGLIETLESLK